MRFLGKHIAVTGAASGLGLAIAQALDAEGAAVLALDRVAAPFAGAKICDVSDEAQVKAAFAGSAPLDGLVNCAGIVRRAAVADTDMDDYDAVMAVNVRGSFLASKYALPLLRAAKGAVLHIASGVALSGLRNRAAYTASKGALVALTRNMALDYAPDQIRVNCLCPGFVDTPLLQTLSPERRGGLLALHPLGRLGTPEDIAHMALFLLSDQAQWITGQAIAVDGGLTIGHAANV